MNRRRFLKYAGATAAVVGASAVGLGHLFFNQNSNLSTATTLSSTSITSASNELADLLLQPFHDYHFDTGQQSDEPALTDLTILLYATGFTQTVQADSNGEYWARNIPVGDAFTYQVQLVKQQNDGTWVKDDRFPWIAKPPEILRGFELPP